ncbi:MAG: GNAT family N-acetyltransferase [Candidatus Babeliales bacterium]
MNNIEINKNRIITRLFTASAIAVLVIFGSSYFYTPQVKISNFDEARDTEFILDLFKKNWHWLVAEGTTFSPEYMLKYRASSQDSSKDHGKEIIKVLYEGNEPVGFVAYHKINFFKCMLHFLAVREEFRSKGYGLQLLQYAVNDLIARGCAEITLVTRTNNYPAQKVYKKVGFKETHRTNGFVYFSYIV